MTSPPAAGEGGEAAAGSGRAPGAAPSLLAKAALGLALLTALLLAAEIAAFLWLASSYSRSAPKIGDALSNFIDDQIDAGWQDPVLSAADPLLRERKILLFQDVNARTAKDVSARLMYLDSLDPKAPIDLYISTQGGWTDNAFTIIDTIRTLSAPVNAWAVGGCYSAGALILASATGRRYATEDAMLMIHASMDDSGEDDARMDRERYEAAWKSTTTIPAAWYPLTGDEEHYLSPKEALQYHLIDAIVPVWKRAAPARRD